MTLHTVLGHKSHWNWIWPWNIWDGVWDASRLE